MARLGSGGHARRPRGARPEAGAEAWGSESVGVGVSGGGAQLWHRHRQRAGEGAAGMTQPGS